MSRKTIVTCDVCGKAEEKPGVYAAATPFQVVLTTYSSSPGSNEEKKIECCSLHCVDKQIASSFGLIASATARASQGDISTTVSFKVLVNKPSPTT